MRQRVVRRREREAAEEVDQVAGRLHRGEEQRVRKPRAAPMSDLLTSRADEAGRRRARARCRELAATRQRERDREQRP